MGSENLNTSKKTEKGGYFVGRALVVLAVMIGVTVLVLVAPDMAKELGNKVFLLATTKLGWAVIIFAIVYCGLFLFLSCSKYGKIRFGNDKPEYSTFAWFAMLFCSSSATAAAFWAFNEWPAIYCYMQGDFAVGGGANVLGGIMTDAAKVELSRAMNLMDWGPVSYGVMSLACVPMAYYFYNKQKGSWSFDVSCERVVSNHGFNSFISTVGLVATFASLGYTTALGVDLITVPLCYVLGIEPTFTLKIVMMVIVSALFTLTSYVGIGKGMKKISNAGAYIFLGICLYVLIFSGYGTKILNSTVSALGLATNEYVRMLTWTEPYESSNLAQNWPIFYVFSFTMYAPFIGAFIGKISKGRSIKQVALVSVFGAFAGFIVLHGILGGFVAELMFDGKVDVLGIAQSGDGAEMVIQALMQLPLGKIAIIAYVLMSVLFLATTMDAGTHTLASGIKRNFKPGEETSPAVRFMWALAVSLFPLGLVFINADIPTIKSLTMVVTIPVFIMLVIQTVSFMRQIKDDYGHKSKEEIEEEFRLEA